MSLILLFFIIAITVLWYVYHSNKYNYWSKRNIKHDRPSPFIGNHYESQFRIKHIVDVSMDLYKRYPDEKVIGYYERITPKLIIKDLDIIKRILTLDFRHFSTRGISRDPEVEFTHQNLFHADGDLWKLIRQHLTPAFTTAKIKSMFPLIVACAAKLQKKAAKIDAAGGQCDVHELMSCFTIEFIGSCGFSIDMDTINNEHSRFRQLARNITDVPLTQAINRLLWELFPLFRRFINVANSETEGMLLDIVKQVIKQRNGEVSGRNDFIDLLLQIKSSGKLQGESLHRVESNGKPVQLEKDMDLKCMTAQVFIFFVAGFETSTAATSFSLHELAYNPQLQRRVQKEIDSVLLKYNNTLCYDAIAEMSLLNMVLQESMRMSPPGGVLFRTCTKKYTIPELAITIDPGVKILIPVHAIHNDEKYYEKPTEFNPERFIENAVKVRHKYAYLPFGEGPRICIGKRMGEMQSLAGLAAILQKFSLEPALNTVRKPKLNPQRMFVVSFVGGMPLKLKLRQN